jgi:hypothetical protein
VPHEVKTREAEGVGDGKDVGDEFVHPVLFDLLRARTGRVPALVVGLHGVTRGEQALCHPLPARRELRPAVEEENRQGEVGEVPPRGCAE